MGDDDRQRFVIYWNEGELLDVKRDIYMLHRHLDLVKREMESEEVILVREREEAAAQISGGELDVFLVAALEHSLDEQERWYREGVPRIVINPFVVAVWSLYESVLTGFARIVQKSVGAELPLEDIRGPPFVGRVEKYFRKVLRYPLKLTDHRREELRLLGDIRNSIVHCYGKISHLRRDLRSKIASGKIDGVSVASETGRLVLSVQFADRAFENVREHVLTLLNEYQTS